jgi:hypothetical protein
MTEYGPRAVVDGGGFEANIRGNSSGGDIHPDLSRETAPDIDNPDAYDIDSELKQFLNNPLVIDQLKRVDTVFDIPAMQTNTILDAILRKNGAVPINSLIDTTHFDAWGHLEDAIFVLENRNIVETRTINGEEFVAFHNGGLEAVRRARHRDSVTIHMIEDELDREPKDDPLAKEGC